MVCLFLINYFKVHDNLLTDLKISYSYYNNTICYAGKIN